ncbi:SCO2584 family spore wall biosynthesis protein, partial [Streptomyces sp. NPDC000880]
MPDDVGGKPFPDGWEPDDDRGGADEDFASVVFDEDFVRAAEIHEPTAVERLLAAAQAFAGAPRTDGLLSFHVKAVPAGWVSSA